ncbi:penicillin-binding protein 1B [Thiohalocapsa marina]|uniref:penicillin-binding protein 1B n=1 Tax=Thiohalocapsa marina TaxID=424902 RepID=UPI0036DE05A4
MATPSRKPARRGRQPRRRRRGLRLFGLLFRLGLLVAVAVGLGAVLYGIHLDELVYTKFEGKRWALPARVYGRPLELYVGRPLSVQQLTGELQRLGYRDESGAGSVGTWHVDGAQVLVHNRAFRFWDGVEPQRRLRIGLSDGVILDLTDADSGAPIALARLDPALIASIYPTHNEDRVLLRREQLPPLLIKTLLAVEDRKFYQHLGIDPKGILRAAIENLSAGRTVQGASTLTQQLVKNFYLTQERTLERKLNEAYMAVLLERRYSKDEILTAYANEVYLGQDGSRAIHGFGLASQFYFNRNLNELDVPQTALLVGILKGPSEYNPRRRPEKVLERRNLVIDLMAYHQIISRDEAEQAKQAPLGLREGGARPSGDYPAFIQLVRRQLQRDYREEDLRSEGLRIFTTLDPLTQSQVEGAVRERLPQLDEQRKFPPGTLETAVVVTSVAQGEVLALVGARDTDYAGFNRALDAVRPIGSLIKPVVYLSALERPEQYSLVTSIPDTPVSLRAGADWWEPQNYDRKVHGNVPLYRALAKSYNLATVNLGLDLGVNEVADTLNRLGAMRRIDRVPAMLLGSVSLSPVEVAQVYQTIAAGGFRAPLRTIREVLDASGRPLNRYPLAVEPVVGADAAFLTQWAMRKVVEQGTATWLGSRLPDGLVVAGKTGTTNELRDSWFAGFSGDRVVVAWVGRDDNKPTRLTGSSGALRLWGDIMATIEAQSLDLTPPGDIVVADACGSTGIPFSRDHVGVCGAGAEEDMLEAEEPPAVAAEPDEPAPRPAWRSGGSGGASNPFLSDFYGN